MYSVRGMPSAGRSGFSWNGRQETAGGAASGHSFAYSASAASSRRLPMKHQGHTTSETTSIDRVIARNPLEGFADDTPLGLGPRGPPTTVRFRILQRERR